MFQNINVSSIKDKGYLEKYLLQQIENAMIIKMNYTRMMRCNIFSLLKQLLIDT